MNVVCRICFNAYSDLDCFPLSSLSGFSALKTIEKVLKNVIPEMNTALIKDSQICISCWGVLSQSYKLKLKCLENEQQLYEFLVKNQMQGSINDYVFTECPPKEENVDVKDNNLTKIEEKKADLLIFDSDEIFEDPSVFLAHQQLKIDDCNEIAIPLVDSAEKEKVTNAKKSKKVEEKTIICSSCKVECCTTSEALIHVIQFHGVHIFLSCKHCNYFFMDTSSLQEHKKTHQTTYLCQFCGRNLVSRKSLTRHINNLHRKTSTAVKAKPVACGHCGLTFTDRSALKKHKKTHRRKLYTCEICGSSHADRRLLNEHKNIHSNIKRYMCEKCGQCFKQKSVLWLHNYKFHINKKTKQCPHCPKKFFRNYDLKIHINVHTGERKHQCHVCLKRFSNPHNVIRHMVVHTGEKFKCDICGRSYAQKYCLKQHVCQTDAPRITRKDDSVRKATAKNYPPKPVNMVNCEICCKAFKTTYMKFHMRSHTGEKPEICKVCGKGFSTFPNLRRHKMIHSGKRPFKCDECNQDFIQKVDLQAHTRRRHTGEKPYECKICDKKFVEFSVLQRHRKTQAHQLALEAQENKVKE